LDTKRQVPFFPAGSYHPVSAFHNTVFSWWVCTSSGRIFSCMFNRITSVYHFIFSSESWWI